MDLVSQQMPNNSLMNGFNQAEEKEKKQRKKAMREIFIMSKKCHNKCSRSKKHCKCAK